jgi:hypothetical protein
LKVFPFVFIFALKKAQIYISGCHGHESDVSETLVKCLDELRKSGCSLAWKVVGKKNMMVNVKWDTEKSPMKETVKGLLNRAKRVKRPANKKRKRSTFLKLNGTECHD